MRVVDSTRTLVARAQQRDDAAVDELFRRYRARLRGAIRKLLGERYRRTFGDSEDAVQDGVLAALRRLGTFEYRGEGSFLAWLLKAAEFEVRHRIQAMAAKKRQGDAAVGSAGTRAREVPAAMPSPSEVAAAVELEERIEACLDRMPPRERRVIVLSRYLGLGMEEIRDELRLPTAAAARALLSRAQARLADLLPDA
jgi:RNA polymerase sigma factor (sigma-70 family)